jgi:hypothetical protein
MKNKVLISLVIILILTQTETMLVKSQTINERERFQFISEFLNKYSGISLNQTITLGLINSLFDENKITECTDPCVLPVDEKDTIKHATIEIKKGNISGELITSRNGMLKNFTMRGLFYRTESDVTNIITHLNSSLGKADRISVTSDRISWKQEKNHLYFLFTAYRDTYSWYGNFTIQREWVINGIADGNY